MLAAVMISVAGVAARRETSGEPVAIRYGFTLVELLVTMVIIAILAALSLAGLAGVRQRAKADKTRNTIRKIDAVIRPMYDSYRTRRVADLQQQTQRDAAALQLLDVKRRLMAYEMPDRWEDVPITKNLPIRTAAPVLFRTAAVRSYASARAVASASHAALFGSAECLFMVLERSGYEPDALEFFRVDEIGDVDGDGRREFLDGWGRPIAFLRWAPGFVSTMQIHDANAAHDPLDPMRVDSTAYALVPLIYSAGPDGATGGPNDDQTGYGLATFPPGQGWTIDANGDNRGLLALLQNSIATGSLRVGQPLPGDTSSLDNITNHDLLKK